MKINFYKYNYRPIHRAEVDQRNILCEIVPREFEIHVGGLFPCADLEAT